MNNVYNILENSYTLVKNNDIGLKKNNVLEIINKIPTVGLEEHVTHYKPVMNELNDLFYRKILREAVQLDPVQRFNDIKQNCNNVYWHAPKSGDDLRNPITAFDHLDRILDKFPPVTAFDRISYNKSIGDPNGISIRVFNDRIASGVIHGKTNLDNASSVEEYSEMIHRTTEFLSNTLTSSEIDFISKLSEMNEKYVFMSMLTLLYAPLKYRLWGVLVVFAKYSGYFTTFMQTIAKQVIFSTGTLMKGIFFNLTPTLIQTKFLGLVSGVSLVLYKTGLLNRLFSTAVYTPSIYGGLSGVSGEIVKHFTVGGSRIIYEAARTFSTFTNAALAGFLEPKRDVIKHFMENYRALKRG